MSDLLIRSFDAKIDPTTLVARLITYGKATTVVDLGPNGPERYEEAFVAGAFTRQFPEGNEGAVRRVRLMDEHPGVGSGKVGFAVEIHDTETELLARFKLLDSRAADVATLFDNGVTDVSIGFLPTHTKPVNGVRMRLRAHLDHVALVPEGAYPQARVLALREAADEAEQEAAEAALRERERKELEAWLRNEQEHQEAIQARFGG